MPPQKSSSRFVKWVVVLVVAVGLGGGGAWYVVYSASVDTNYRLAEAAYAQGVAALDNNDGQTAVQRFSEADLKLQKAHDAVNLKVQKLPRESAEFKKLAEKDGHIYWLWAQNTRDLTYAKALVDQKPLSVIDDTSTGEKFRNFAAAREAEEFGKTIACLRTAAELRPDDATIVKNALRTELMLPNPNWEIIERFAQNTYRLNPKDTRALFFLARIEFDQPDKKDNDRFENRAPAKRVASRMTKSREYLEKLKEAGKYPLWRTLHLEAQLHEWFAANAERTQKTAERDKEEQALRDLLMNSSTGALQRAMDGDEMKSLSSWDLNGVIGLHQMAIDLALRDRKKPGASDVTPALTAMESTIQVGKKLSENPTHRSAAAELVTQAAEKLQQVWVEQPTAQGRAQMQSVMAIIREAQDSKSVRPTAYADAATLMLRQAWIERRRNSAEAEKLEKDAVQTLEAGIKAAQEAKLSDVEISHLHVLAADFKASRGAKREALASHLEALRKVPREAKRPYAMANLLEGMLLEREGRLERAMEHFDRVVSSNVPDMAMRAHMSLGGIRMAMGQPELAVSSLESVERNYANFETLAPEDRAWVYQFVENPRQISAMLAIAHLETAKVKIARQTKNRPIEPGDFELARIHENEVCRILDKLKPPEPVNLYVRQAVCAYLMATSRVDAAINETTALQNDYPASEDVLRASINAQVVKALASLPAGERRVLDDKTRARFGQEIQDFIAKYPTSTRAKLFWAEWQIRNGHAAEAQAYLKNPANFPGVQDAAFQRVLAAAMIESGDRAGGMKLLEYLPSNPMNDLVMIQLTANREEQSKKLGEAIARYESNGLFRCIEGRTALRAGNYAAAVDSFMSAMEFTRVKAIATDGLQRAFFGMADADPTKARDAIWSLLVKHPNEPALLLPMAYAHLLLDETGSPLDAYDKAKTMGGALNQWENVALKDSGANPIVMPLTKSKFWVLANRVDLARNEVVRALVIDGKNVQALLLLASLELDSQVPALWSEARKSLAAVKAIDPNNVLADQLLATADERDGKLAEAVVVLEQSLVRQPAQSATWARLIGLFEMLGDSGQALTKVRMWRTRYPDDLLANENEIRLLAKSGKLNDAKAAAEAFDRLANDQAKTRATTPPPAGVDAKEWAKRMEVETQSIRIVARLAIGRGFIRARSWEDGEKWLKRITDMSPDLESALLILGDSYIERKQWKQARDVYERIVKRNPGHYVAGNNLAWVLSAQFKDHARAYQVAVEVRKDRYTKRPLAPSRLDPSFLDTLGVIYQEWANPVMYTEMRDLFLEGFQRYPLDPRMPYYLGKAYAALGQPEKASEMFTAAAALAAPDAKTNVSQEIRKEVLEKLQVSRPKPKTSTN